MSRYFEELDYQPTAIGPISLRRRRELRLDVDVLEIMLGDEHLMSDLFTTSEVALAEHGLAAISDNRRLSVVVGGLGMGFTADAALNDSRIDDLLIIEKLAPVIGWHETGMIPLGKRLVGDPKCRFVEGDFFQMAAGHDGFDPAHPFGHGLQITPNDPDLVDGCLNLCRNGVFEPTSHGQATAAFEANRTGCSRIAAAARCPLIVAPSIESM